MQFDDPRDSSEKGMHLMASKAEVSGFTHSGLENGKGRGGCDS